MAQPLVLATVATLIVIGITQTLSYVVWGGMEGGYDIWIVIMGVVIPACTCFPITLILLRQRRQLHETILRLEETQRQLHETASRDMMTGLLHRQAFKHAVREDSTGVMLMLDVDHFKSINDTYGHLAGDRALVLIASSLHVGTRETDVVARFGGEEFCIFLPGTDEALGLMIAERVRARVEALRFSVEGAPCPLTISIGMAFKTADDPIDAALNAADGALYAAKRAGRNRVVSAGAGRQVRRRKGTVEPAPTASGTIPKGKGRSPAPFKLNSKDDARVSRAGPSPQSKKRLPAHA